MLYTSEVTGKTYKTVEELETAEKEMLSKKEEETKKAEEKKTRAEEIKKAYAHINEVRKEASKMINDAYDAYYKLRDEFIKDYGSFHMSYYDDGKKEELTVSDVIDSFLSLPWLF